MNFKKEAFSKERVSCALCKKVVKMRLKNKERKKCMYYPGLNPAPTALKKASVLGSLSLSLCLYK